MIKGGKTPPTRPRKGGRRGQATALCQYFNERKERFKSGVLHKKGRGACCWDRIEKEISGNLHFSCQVMRSLLREGKVWRGGKKEGP